MNTMKRFLVYLFSMTPLYSLLLLLFLSMNGCTKSVLDGEGSGDGDVMVRFEMDMPSDMRGQIDTRAAGDDENTVSTIHLLAFVEDAPGVYRFDGNTITGTMYTPGAPASFSAKLKTHVKPQRFMILVNAGGVVGNINYNDDIATATSKLVYHRVPEWETGAANFEPLPLYGLSPAVTVTSSTNTVGPFDLVGMHARFDVKVKAGEPSFVLEDVQIFNRKNRGYLYYDPATNWDSSLECVYTANVPGTAPANNEYLPTAIFAVPTTGVNAGKSVGQLYTFEATAQANRLDATAIVVGGYYNGTGSKTYYRIDVPSTVKGGQILRNHLYDIEIQKANGPGAGSAEDAFKGETKIQATITPWSQAKQTLVLDDGQYRLQVSHDKFLFGEFNETRTLKVVTDHPDAAGITCSIDYTLGASTNWASLTTSGTAQNKTIDIVTTRTTSGGLHEADLTVKVANMNYIVKLRKDRPTEISIKHYIGTFHKANQTGERVIRIPAAGSSEVLPADMYGPWTAEVIKGTDFIKLDAFYGNRTWPLQSTAAENEQVIGEATSVSGIASATDPIYFRVGMKSMYTPTAEAPARYGIIRLSFGHLGYYDLYVRQGEGADYLMRNNNVEDAYNNGTLRTRSCKFSPYNLTAAELKNGSWTGGTGYASSNPVVPQRLPVYPATATSGGGVFTDFPTQGGGFFQWTNGNTYFYRKAYHQNNPIAMLDWSKVGIGGSSAFWSPNLIAEHESCPPGYRRPAEGPFDMITGPSTALAVSEMRQSLWLNPPESTISNADNVIMGYLADGFFDRGLVISTVTGETDSKVENRIISPFLYYDNAYIGMLFFNPNTKASLFFPFSGFRDDNGVLKLAGFTSYYWSSGTSNSSGTDSKWSMIIGKNNVRTVTGASWGGKSIRCVEGGY